MSDILQQLSATLEQRRSADPGESYVADLHHRGLNRILEKVGEEATEVVIEAVQKNKKMLVEESVDLLYFMLVLWRATGVSPDRVWEEMASRHGLPEHEERAKRARTKQR